MKESRLITFDNAVYSRKDMQPKTGDTKTEKKVLVNDINKEKIKEKSDDK
jgi:hypothetical protein